MAERTDHFFHSFHSVSTRMQRIDLPKQFGIDCVLLNDHVPQRSKAM